LDALVAVLTVEDAVHADVLLIDCGCLAEGALALTFELVLFVVDELTNAHRPPRSADD